MFDPSLYQYSEAQPSWWEASVGERRVDAPPLENSESCEVAIIGGGYTGLSAAYHLAKEYNVDVRVLEAGHIGWGASGRNGGFCCMGGTQLGIGTLIKKYGLEEARKYYQAQVEAVDLVRQIGIEEDIDFEAQGDAELVVAEKPAHYKELEKECATFNDKLGLECSMIEQDEFRETGYDAPHQHGALAIKPGFGLNPLKYCMGLGDAALRAGAKLHANSEVTIWEKNRNQHRLRTANGGELTASNVIVACNGFMPEHLHRELQGRALPLQSQIIVTRPLTDDEVATYNWKTQSPAINSRNVYCYFRLLPDNRFLIGSRGDFKGTPEGAEVSAERLRLLMVELWPEWQNIPIEYTWRGFVCFTSKLRPAIGRFPSDPSVYFGFGYHGNGVNNATWTGRELARWHAGGNDKVSPHPFHLSRVVHGMTPRIPLPALRQFYTRVGVGWHRFKDMIDR